MCMCLYSMNAKGADNQEISKPSGSVVKVDDEEKTLYIRIMVCISDPCRLLNPRGRSKTASPRKWFCLWGPLYSDV